MKEIQFSVEVPTSLLKEICPLLDYDFIIASTYLQDKEYREHYLNQKGRYIILDNGAFETGESISTDDLFRVAGELTPNIIVIPDARNSYEKTVDKFAEFFHRIPYESPRGIFMGVLQGRSLDDYEDLLDKYKKNNISLIGIPYGVIDRITFIKNHPEVFFHVLGLPYFPEVLSLKHLPNIKSLDTSLPVKVAFNNQYLSNFDCLTAEIRPDVLTEAQVDILKTNINCIKNVCKFSSRLEY